MTTLIHTELFEGFTIKTYALNEDVDPSDSFDEDLEKEFDTFGKIERGELLWFYVTVEASLDGLTLACDSLGGCCYASYAEFLNVDSYYGDMRSEVARAAIKRLAYLAAVHTTLKD